MAAHRPIGILGGMGPEATIRLQRKLMETVPATDDSDHIPLLIDMNTKVPSRIAHLIDGTGVDPSGMLVCMAKRMESAGASALAMPCNTAHHYANAIVDAIEIPFLNMIELTCDLAARSLGRGGRVGVLASPAVRFTKLFDIALAERGLSAVWPQDDAPMLEAIQSIKAQGPNALARQTLQAASAALAEAGAELQFIACSEFSLIAENVAVGVTAIDTLDVLSDAIVGFSQNRVS